MATRPSSREARAARRADASGSGPTLDGREPGRNPGATAKFGLFGEVLMVGLLVTLVSLPVITLPAAMTAGVRHLRRFIRADASPTAAFWRDVRTALPGGLAVGLVGTVATGILILDIDLARSGFLPGGAIVEVVGWVGLAVVAAVLLQAAGLWSPELGWRGAIRATPAALIGDIPGGLYLVATAGFACIATWALVPLIVPALGCAALAIVAIPQRPRRRR